MKNLVKIIILFCFVTLASGAPVVKGEFFFFESPLVGEKAPDFTLKSTGGPEVNLTQYRGGKNAIVFFWTTWCPNCRDHLKNMQTESDVMAKKDIQMILVDLGEDQSQVKSYLKKLKVSKNVLLDLDETVGEEYGIYGVPTFIFIDKAGVVKAVEHSLPDNYETIFSQEEKEEG